MPGQVPMHWDASGLADRFGSKYELMLGLPFGAAVALAAGALAEGRLVLPPHALRRFISFLQFFFLSVFFVLQVAALLRANRVAVETERLIAVPAAILFAYAGSALDGAGFQSLFGVKTRWTMADEGVWRRTNRLAAVLFTCAAFAMLAALPFPRAFHALLVGQPLAILAFAWLYSRWIGRK
jgi:uncharacterized membrane protein